jgi:AraC-like DNA-binding protein
MLATVPAVRELDNAQESPIDTRSSHRVGRLVRSRQVDVLSDAVTAMRTGRPHSARHERRAPWSMRFESFEGAGFHVVLQGACRLLPARGEPIALGAGDVVFLRPGVEHGLADSPASASAVLLCGGYLLDAARTHPLLADVPEILHLPARVGRHSALRAAVDLLGAELERPRPGRDAVVPALLDVLLLLVLRSWFDDRRSLATAGWAAALGDPAVGAALESVHADPARPWTVRDLGRRASLSRAAFARRFTALVGMSPLAYVTWWRMTLAARLLRESDAPLAEVADRVGYTSEYAFARAFKRARGSPPGRFRRG